MTTNDYILAADLAHELDVTTSEILARADQILQRRFDDGGLEAIRGLSTGTRLTGSGPRLASVATISTKLAAEIRGAGQPTHDIQTVAQGLGVDLGPCPERHEWP